MLAELCPVENHPQISTYCHGASARCHNMLIYKVQDLNSMGDMSPLLIERGPRDPNFDLQFQ